ncbi:MAG: hypothetical protein JWO12_2846 [Frankiales bacterium]|nr:hypothetical protein [Frankiales bacterium]
MTEVLTRRFTQAPPQTVLPRSPWLVGDTLAVGVVNVVGLGMILGGLQGTRHTTDPHNLLLLVNVAAAGLVVSLAGNAVFLLSALRHVGTLRSDLLGAREAVREVAPTAAIEVSDVLVSASSMTRFHRAGCPAVQGKAVTAGSLAKHLKAGRTACDLCTPTGGTG